MSKAEVVDRLCGDGRLDDAEQESFRAFCTILRSLFHFEFHARLERLGLSTRDESGAYRVLDLARAKERLDYVWDNYFQYNHP